MTWAIIGGTGFEKLEGFEIIELLNRETPFGEASSGLARARVSGTDILFLPRHGLHHDNSPTEVNYRANIFALKKYGARKILSVSSVGSLQAQYKPNDCVVPYQYLNFTRGFRASTFCTDGLVGHVSLADPISLELAACLQEMQGAFDFDLHFGATHVVVEGPTYSTRAESEMFRQMGAGVIGMTNYPEYALAREAGICYLPLSFVTDYDCWKTDEPHVTIDEVAKRGAENVRRAFIIAQKLIPDTNRLLPHGCIEQSLKTGMMTSPSDFTSDQKAWLDVLLQD